MKLAILSSALILSTSAFAKPEILQKINFKGAGNMPAQARIIVDTVTAMSKLVITETTTSGQRQVIVNENLELPMNQYSGPEKILATNAAGSLLINLGSNFIGIGRFSYSTTLTVAYRENAYKLVGFTHTSIDKLDPKSYQSCDYNLLTGKGIKNGRKVRISTEPTRIDMLTFEDTTSCEVID